MNAQVAEILRARGVDPQSFVEGRSGVWTGDILTADALSIWGSLREVFGETNVWPVLRGDAAELEEPPDELLELSQVSSIPAGTAREILSERFQSECDACAEMIADWSPPESFEAAAAQVDRAGIYSFSGTPSTPVEWKDPVNDKPLQLQTLVSIGSLGKFVSLSLVPAEHPWDAVVVLAFGGWNECPEPAIIAGVLREWNKRFGAVPACMTNSVLECIVDRPPRSETDCLALAAEQWILCDDIVGQGTQSVHKLAAELSASPHWFFWWD